MYRVVSYVKVDTADVAVKQVSQSIKDVFVAVELSKQLEKNPDVVGLRVEHYVDAIGWVVFEEFEQVETIHQVSMLVEKINSVFTEKQINMASGEDVSAIVIGLALKDNLIDDKEMRAICSYFGILPITEYWGQ